MGKTRDEIKNISRDEISKDPVAMCDFEDLKKVQPSVSQADIERHEKCLKFQNLKAPPPQIFIFIFVPSQAISPAPPPGAAIPSEVPTTPPRRGNSTYGAPHPQRCFLALSPYDSFSPPPSRGAISTPSRIISSPPHATPSCCVPSFSSQNHHP
ncbi:hypothetical protein Fmac_017577 [Flemingia macrophylla]|uniref:Spastin/Vps4 C-terminal domain-containing protein n=1 Tax=Flemingia macrophylla TaxID=520843 RepID=A0ABD1M2H3_9FABA